MKKAKYELAGKVTFGCLFKSLSCFCSEACSSKGNKWLVVEDDSETRDDAYRDSE